jgi:hypothetical protein
LPIKKKSSLKPLGQITIVELFVEIAYGGHVCVQPSLKKNSSLYKADLKHRNRKHKM